MKMMEKIKKYRWVLLVLGLLIYIFRSSIFGLGSNSKNQNIETIVVGSGSISKSISAQGKVAIPQSLEVSFGNAGTVAAINKKVGDWVKKGDLIAMLKHDKDSIGISQSQTNLAMAQSKLNELLKGPDKSILIQIQADMDKSKAFIDYAKTQIDILSGEKLQKYNELMSQINQMDGQIKTAERDHQTTLSQSGQDISDQMKTYSNNIKTFAQSYNSAKIKIADLLEKVDYIFGATAKYDNARDRNGLSARNSSYKDGTKTELQGIYNEFGKISDLNYDNVDAANFDMNGLKANLDILSNFIKRFQNRHTNAYNAVANSVAAGDLTDAQISTYKSTVTNSNSSLDSIYSSLQSNYNQLLSMKSTDELASDSANSISTKFDNIQKLKSSYLSLVNQLNQLDGTYNAQIASQKNTIDSTINNIKYSSQKLSETSKIDPETIKQQKLSIQLQRLSLASAALGLQDYEIRAPFDGKVGKIDFIVGEQVTNASKVTISNPNTYKIDISLDQVDVIYIKQGQLVSIVLSSFPNTTLTGIVDQIYDIPTTDSSNVTSYTVSVLFNNSGLSIFPDMYGSVTFEFPKDKNQKVLIPLKAIQYDTGSSVPFVYIQNSKAKDPVKINVKIGQTDGQYIQIVSGVNLGDKLVVSPYTPQTISKSTFGPPGGGRRPGN